MSALFAQAERAEQALLKVTIVDTGYRPSLTQSRITSSPTPETSAALPELIQTALDKGYTFAKMDTEEYPEIGKRFGVVGLPTIVVLDGSGDTIYRHTGPLKAEPLLTVLHKIDQRH